MHRFRGRTAVITGSASGIGRATALQFAAEGAHVVGGDLNRAGGEETAEMCREAGGSAVFVATDVIHERDIVRLVAIAAQASGTVDVLFNNAGAGGAIGAIEDTPADDWDRTLNILLRSVLFGIKHVVPLMKQRGGGAIVSTSSNAGLRGFAYSHAYCAAKAGVINLTRSAAVELAAFGNRVNCVCPGAIATPMQGEGDAAVLETKLAGRQPIERAGQPGDVAGAVLFLASDDAGWITGHSLTIDGGGTAGVWPYRRNAEPPQHVVFLGPTNTGPLS